MEYEANKEITRKWKKREYEDMHRTEGTRKHVRYQESSGDTKENEGNTKRNKGIREEQGNYEENTGNVRSTGGHDNT